MNCLSCRNNNVVDIQQDIDFASLPLLEITSPPSSIDHLASSDVDLHLPYDMSFQYYNPHEFHDNHYINEYFSDKCFSSLHCNIRCLSANRDNLQHMLSDLYLTFSKVGLTEIKFKVEQSFLCNIEIPGYSFSFQPSLSNAGGVGFYTKEDQLFTNRPDLTLSTDDFETLWVEMQNGSQRNMICGFIYRHPHGNMENFWDFLNSTIEKIDGENKFYVILGDFNLDLLKLDSHPDTDNFLNTLESFNFQPHILQPTRITDHSQTLIDNIFFNSFEHLTLSGNIIYDRTDHLPNFLIIKKFTSLPNKVRFYKRDYSNFDESALIQDIHSVDWEDVLHANANPDPNVMFDSFYT